MSASAFAADGSASDKPKTTQRSTLGALDSAFMAIPGWIISGANMKATSANAGTPVKALGISAQAVQVPQRPNPRSPFSPNPYPPGTGGMPWLQP